MCTEGRIARYHPLFPLLHAAAKTLQAGVPPIPTINHRIWHVAKCISSGCLSSNHPSLNKHGYCANKHAQPQQSTVLRRANTKDFRLSRRQQWINKTRAATEQTKQGHQAQDGTLLTLPSDRISLPGPDTARPDPPSSIALPRPLGINTRPNSSSRLSHTNPTRKNHQQWNSQSCREGKLNPSQVSTRDPSPRDPSHLENHFPEL